jgi:uncharacterized caspase-like protein
MTLRKTFLMCLALIPLLTVAAQQKYALVIGNAAYTVVTRLNNPVNDANDIAGVLRNMGFQVEVVLNGNLDLMERAVIRLKDHLSGSDGAYGFFFYAGRSLAGRTT